MTGYTLLIAVACLACVGLTAAAPPEQIHLAFAGKSENGYPTGFSVSWFTQDACSSFLIFTQAGSSSSTNVSGVSKQYLASYGFHHRAYMTELEPEAAYTYRVGGPECGYSDVMTAQAPSNRSDLTFGVHTFGDMGWLGSDERPMVVALDGLVKNWTAVPTRRVMEDLKNSKRISMVWHVGDIGYMDDAYAHHPTEFNYESVYNGYMNWLQNVSSVMPYMVSPGNHESECHSPTCLLDMSRAKALSNFSAYNTRWHMPSAESGGVANMWYSFNYGPIHFISVNSETDFPGAGEENTGDSGDPMLPAGHFAPPGAYLQWLEEDLKQAQAERGVRPWVVAGGHRPFREISGNGVSELFDKYNVDLYLAGHTHSYVRSMPVSASAGVDTRHSTHHVRDADGTVLIVAGGAGCEEMPYIGVDDFDTEFGVKDADAPDAYMHAVPVGSEVYATAALASGLLTVVNRSALHFELISSRNGTILDHVWLTKTLP